jgi:hypothetical protein
MKKKNATVLLIAFGCTFITIANLSCSKSNNNNNQNPPPVIKTTIDGYDSSNDVAKDSLSAHWTFDNTEVESISGTVPMKNTGDSYTSGQIGNALMLANGYLVYPVVASLNKADALQSYTISLWVDIVNSGISKYSFFELSPTDLNNPFGQIGLSDPNGYGGDTLPLEVSQLQITSQGNKSEDWNLIPTGTPPLFFAGAETWSFLVLTFDGASQTLSVYTNGSLFSSKQSTSVVAPATLTLQTPNQVLVGTYAFTDDGFVNSVSAASGFVSHGISASIDDLRIFNAALSATQIKALYDLGAAHR